MASANDRSKRRRLLDDASPGATCISDMPNGVLTHAASYLDAPSRAFFAASLSGQNASADERNIAIVDHEWSTLDFGDIEKDLVVRLSDGDISSFLLCVDAVNKLKRLKLTNCLHITGECLEPLRGSEVIEQIDLSLVEKHQSPDLDPPPPISCDVVLPILDSIIEREGCSLMHLQFPAKWRKKRRSRNDVDENSAQFDQFLRRYSDTLLNRGVNLGVIGCQKCDRNVVRETENHWIELYGYHFGSQHYTCCECLGYYCRVCEDDGWLAYCERCESRLCEDCQSTKYCAECQECYCVDCHDFIECSVCNRYYRCKDCGSDWGFCCKCESHFCSSCWSGGKGCNDCEKYCCDDCVQEFGWPECRRCYQEFCGDCNEKKDIDAIRICKRCDEYSCGRCLVSMMDEDEQANDFCVGCVQLAGRLLVEKNNKVQKEYEEAKAENKELKHQIGQMQKSNDSLKHQLQYKDRRVKDLEEKMKQTNMM